MLERNHPVAETPCAVCDSESLILQEEAFCEEAADMEFDFIPKKSSHLWGIGYWDSVYDMQTDTAVGVDNLVDICPENLQDLKPGDQLLINRDPENPRRLQVCRLNGSMVPSSSMGQLRCHFAHAGRRNHKTDGAESPFHSAGMFAGGVYCCLSGTDPVYRISFSW